MHCFNCLSFGQGVGRRGGGNHLSDAARMVRPTSEFAAPMATQANAFSDASLVRAQERGGVGGSIPNNESASRTISTATFERGQPQTSGTPKLIASLAA